MYHRRMWKGLGIAGALWLASSALASAQEERSPEVVEAEAEFERAEVHYRSERWALAAESYQRSFDLMLTAQHPRRGWVAFFLGRSLERVPGREADALTAYRRFLELTANEAPQPELAEDRAAAGQRIAELEARGVGGGTISPVGPIILGVGAATLVAGFIAGGVALADGDALRVECGGTVCSGAETDRVQSVNTMSAVADALIFGGASIAAVGVVLLLALQHHPRAHTEAQPTLTCGPLQCTFGGRF